MTDKLEQYTDVVIRLAKETVACCPDTWMSGTLFMQSDGMRLTYQLKNDASIDRATISELLRDLIDELYVRMSSNGDAWTESQVSWTRDGNDLQYNMSFEYEQ